jgi:hypothetical protein
MQPIMPPQRGGSKGGGVSVLIETRGEVVTELLAALELSREIIRETNKWKPGTRETDRIRRAIKLARAVRKL